MTLTSIATGAITLRTNYTAAQTNAAIITVGDTQRLAVTQLQVTADNANTVDVQVRIGFGATTTPTTTGVVGTHPGIPAGGGFTRGTGAAVIGIGAPGQDLRITSEVPTTGSIDILVTYLLLQVS